MSLVFIKNNENIVGERLIDFFSKDKTNTLLFKKTFQLENIKSELQDENIFIFNSKFLNEIELLNEDYASEICENLNEIFRLTKYICQALIESGKKGKFVFITVNSSIQNILDINTSPITDEAIHSFVKSIAKEMSPFNIVFNAVCINPIAEMLAPEQIRSYRKKMNIFGPKKLPLKLEELIESINYITTNKSMLFSGQIYFLG